MCKASKTDGVLETVCVAGKKVSASEPTIEQCDLLTLVEHCESVQGHQKVGEVYRLFEGHKHEYVAVLDGRRLLGMISRGQLGFLLGSRYGFSLYNHRPILHHMMPQVLKVKRGSNFLGILDQALSRTGEEFYDDIVLVDETDLFLGIIPMQVLVYLQSKLLTEKIRLSGEQQQTLAEKNRDLFRSVTELRQSQGRYEILFEHSALGVALLNAHGEVEHCNQRLRRLFGDSLHTAAGLLPNLAQAILPKDADAFHNLLRQQAEATGTGKTHHGEFTVPLSGRGHRLFKMFTSSIDETGQICVFLDDITEQRVLERQMIQREKSALLESLVGGIAHEINNRLSPIVGYTELALMELERSSNPQKLREYFQTVRDNALESGKIIRQLLQLSKPADRDASLCNLTAVVQDALMLLKFRFRELGLEPELDHPTSPPWVMADPSQIKQVVVNLVINALDAMEQVNQRSLGIRVELVGRQAVLSVTDNGHGIKPEHLNRIFDPFFTTKGPQHGTGLGLSVCFSIIKQYGGEITVQSAPGKGTIFRVSLLVTDAISVESVRPLTTTSTLPPPRQIRALVVDDEEYITGFVQEVLRSKNGYEVEWAFNGQQAVERLKKNPFDIVISDVRMPVMDGVQLFEWIRHHQPGLCPHFFFITGDVGSPNTASKIDDLGVPILRKPFNLSALIEQCQQVVRQ
ncbi:MAG: ATP-binding protein [Verrucomicrobiota bacterium]